MSQILRLVVLRDVVSQARSSGASQAVFGRLRLGEGLTQVLALEPLPGVACEQVGIANPEHADPERCVELVLPEATVQIELVPDAPLPDEIEIIDLKADLASRRRGLVPETGLGRRTVALFGAGSLGSKVGVLLAEAGVGRFLVTDDDRLDGSNLSRHACDVLDLGRGKARALSDLLVRRGTQATPLARDISTFEERALDGMLEACDLSIATTDSPAAQFLVNEACVRTKIPGLFLGAWQQARGGELVAFRSGATPCLFCCTGFRAQLPSGIERKERRRAYQDADQNRLASEPGLGADISYLASAGAAYALALLDPQGCRSALLAQSDGFVLLHGGSTPLAEYQAIFERPFEIVIARVRRQEPCPVCGWRTEEAIA